MPKYRWQRKRKRIRHPRPTVNNSMAHNSLGITSVGHIPITSADIAPININTSELIISHEMRNISFSEVNEGEVPTEGFEVVSLDNLPDNTLYISSGDHYYRIEGLAVE